MTNYILVLFLTFLSCDEHSKCSKFKDGSFKMVDDIAGTTLIERKGDKQIEYGLENKLKIEFRVKWVSECSYTLNFVQILENPNNIEYPQDILSKITLTTKIIESKSNSYIQETTSDQYEYVTRGEIFLNE